MKIPRAKVNRRQIIIIAILVILFFMMMDLNNRLSTLSRLTDERNISQTDYVELLVTQASLRTQIAYATSEAAVEDYARDKAHLAQPGDIVVVPIAEEGVQPTQSTSPRPTLQPINNFEVWKALILGE